MKIVSIGADADALTPLLSPLDTTITSFEGDLCQKETVAQAIDGAEAILYAPRLLTPETMGRELGDLLRGSYNLFCAAAENHTTRRLIVCSTQRFFSRMPKNWRVHPGWRPRPTTEPEELIPYLTELSAREITRASGRFNASAGLHLTVLRFGDGVDAVRQAEVIAEALNRHLPQNHSCSFRIVPIGDPPGRPEPTTVNFEEILAPRDPIAPRPIQKVALVGAAGPVLAALAQELAGDYALRLSDLHTMSAVRAAAKPQSPGAPLPVPPEELPASRLATPHDEITADVGDPEAVFAVCADCDAIINGTVLRHEPVAAFRVNAQGAYNLCQAAVRYRINRLVQTGPLQVHGFSEDDYGWDWAIDQPPARPGRHLYGHSKFLGQEICRVFAENFGLSVPNLLYTQFVSPGIRPGWGSPMLVTWDDSARALRAALEVTPEQLGSPYEEFHISNTVPHDTYRYDRARRILGWNAQDDVSFLWQEPRES